MPGQDSTTVFLNNLRQVLSLSAGKRNTVREKEAKELKSFFENHLQKRLLEHVRVRGAWHREDRCVDEDFGRS